jgi:hypothetical protein
MIDKIEKIKNKTYGFFPQLSTIIGVTNRTVKEPIQFVVVADGTTFVGIISGTYSHETVATVNPFIKR